MSSSRRKEAVRIIEKDQAKNKVDSQFAECSLEGRRSSGTGLTAPERKCNIADILSMFSDAGGVAEGD